MTVRESQLILGLGMTLLVFLACSPTSTVPASQPNVLILSIESLRWDHLGVAGYDRPVSPNIDRLAGRGTYFPQGYAQCSWTRPSVASTFTGAYMSTHQVYGEKETKDGTPLVDRDESELSRIPEQFDTLAERFADGARGEVTIVIEGAAEPVAASSRLIDTAIRARAAAGGSPSDVARDVARATGTPRSAVYDRVRALLPLRDS